MHCAAGACGLLDPLQTLAAKFMALILLVCSICLATFWTDELQGCRV